VWAALQQLANTPHRKPNKATKPATKAKTARKGAKKASAAKSKNAVAASEPREGSKKAEVIALLRRAKGVSLSEIQKLTGWQKHTIRGFVSLLSSKAGLKIISARNDAGERIYRTVK
jgi:ribosomal protein L7/L12